MPFISSAKNVSFPFLSRILTFSLFMYTSVYAVVLASLRWQLQQRPWSAWSVFCWCLLYKNLSLVWWRWFELRLWNDCPWRGGHWRKSGFILSTCVYCTWLHVDKPHYGLLNTSPEKNLLCILTREIISDCRGTWWNLKYYIQQLSVGCCFLVLFLFCQSVRQHCSVRIIPDVPLFHFWLWEGVWGGWKAKAQGAHHGGGVVLSVARCPAGDLGELSE